MNEKGSVKIRTEKYISKNGLKYIKVTFYKQDKSLKHRKGTSVDIPASDIQEIISELQKEVQSDWEKTTQNFEEDRRYIDIVNAEELKENLKAYILSGKKVDAAAKCFADAYSKSEECLVELHNLERYQKKLELYYEKLEKIEEMYNLKIRDYMPLFNAVKEDLACFAGCVSENLFESLSASIFNKKLHMSQYVARNMNLLDKMSDIQDFPELESPSYKKKEGNDTYTLPEQYYEYVEKINSLMEYSKDIEEIRGLSLEDVSYICSQWEPYTEEICLMGTYFSSEKKRCIEKKREYENKCTECKSMIEQYEQGAKTVAANILSHEKEWHYYRLLQLACPLIKEICSKEGEFNSEEAICLCKQTWKLLDDFNKENRKYQFCWISHHDEVSMKSEDICVDFIEGEADWPGLYLYTLDNPEKFICIAPGRISAA